MKPETPIALGFEFRRERAKLQKKFRTLGKPTLDDRACSWIEALVAAAEDMDPKGSSRTEMMAPDRGVPADAHLHGMSRTFVEMAVRQFWRAPDFALALMARFRAFDLKRDSIDNEIAAADPSTPPNIIADRVDARDGRRNASRVHPDTVKKRRQRLMRDK